ncbi:MAG: fumarylacetoacetate hydrolase family protein, partial [Acidobacteria bacterium]|nr:fumarylacetoacetate hydrolase family protein [Acidobacteriota bacterium]
MKICRFISSDNTTPRYGLVEREAVLPLEERDVFARRFTPRDATQRLALDEVRLVAPVAPTKIVCVGRNYREHAAELGNELPQEPLLFLKAPSSLIGHEEAIRLTPFSERVEHEGELAVVIGRRASWIEDDEDPLRYALGYT